MLRTKRWYWSFQNQLLLKFSILKLPSFVSQSGVKLLARLYNQKKSVFTDFFPPGHFLRKWNVTTVSSARDRGSLWSLPCLFMYLKIHHLPLWCWQAATARKPIWRTAASHSGLWLCYWSREHHKWVGISPYDDVCVGRIWGRLFWEIVYDLWG